MGQVYFSCSAALQSACAQGLPKSLQGSFLVILYTVLPRLGSSSSLSQLRADLPSGVLGPLLPAKSPWNPQVLQLLKAKPLFHVSEIKKVLTGYCKARAKVLDRPGLDPQCCYPWDFEADTPLLVPQFLHLHN